LRDAGGSALVVRHCRDLIEAVRFDRSQLQAGQALVEVIASALDPSSANATL
jgi:hypothetical protein